MIFSTVWDRYFKNFGGFAMTGLGVFLLGLGAWVVMAIVSMAMIVPLMLRMGRTFMEMGPMGPYASPMMGAKVGFEMFMAMLPMIIVMLVLSLFLYGFVGGGVMGAVVAHRQGLPVEFGTFWAYGARYFWRMSGLAALYGLLGAALGLVIYVPLARFWMEAFFNGRIEALALMVPLMFLLYLVGAVVGSVIIVNTVIYPAYLIVNDGKGVMEAYGAGWRNITGNFGEAVLGGPIMVLFSLAMMLAAVINIIPLLGFLAYMAFLVFLLPMIFLYFSERFEQRIRPTL